MSAPRIFAAASWLRSRLGRVVLKAYTPSDLASLGHLPLRGRQEARGRHRMVGFVSRTGYTGIENKKGPAPEKNAVIVRITVEIASKNRYNIIMYAGRLPL